ncbi:MAG TPA: T9SS type A sorting domain-containing protein, partial [Bacteroidales bacterium]|nr:T9SS type A sorting domain-containing protein [Bacteroidales bacterium]
PSAAGTITGTSTVCQGQQGVIYFVETITGATGYVWTLPAGATIATGENTNSITVNYSNTAISGDITVYGTNTCGNGTVSPAFAVTINSGPSAAGMISGLTTVYQRQNRIAYSVPLIENATGYVWTLPTGATIESGDNTNSIIASFSASSISGNISVYGTNSCGNGTSSSQAITVVPSHFVFTGGNASDPTYTIYLPSALLDAVDLQFGDEISVFDGTTMVGAFTLSEVLTPANQLANVMVAFSTLNTGSGYVAGDPVTFKCFDVSAGVEISNFEAAYSDPFGGAWTQPYFPSADAEYSFASLNFHSFLTQSINLNVAGFQYVSSYLVPQNPNMKTICTNILNNLDYVKNNAGLMLRKIGPNWVNGIGNWNPVESYVFKMKGQATLNIHGFKVDPLTPFNFVPGFQFVSYIHDYPMDAKVAFTSILSKLNYVKNTAGLMLRKIGPNWVNGIGNLKPGEGYIVNMKNASTFTYPLADLTKANNEFMASQHFVFEGGDAASPVYTVYIADAKVNGVDLQVGDEIGVFDGETLVGSLALTQVPTAENQFENAIPIFTVLNSGTGYQPGNAVSFKIWKASENLEYEYATFDFSNPYGDAHTSATFPDDDAAYSIASLKVSATDIIDYNKPVFITSAFPNPFSQRTTIEYTLRDNAMVTLLLYNSVGQKVKTLSDSRELQGKHSIELDGTTLQPGVYYLRLEAITNSDKLTDLRKIVLVK